MTKSDYERDKLGFSPLNIKKHSTWAGNQVRFRDKNENVQKGFDALDLLALQDDQEEFIDRTNTVLQYRCECADVACISRVKILQSKYNSIHMNRSRFTIVAGHEKSEVEDVAERYTEYNIIEKIVARSA